MFHLIPLAEAFTRGYFETFQILLELGARPCLDLERNTFRSFGTDLFLTGAKGRQHFIQLLFEHGKRAKCQLDFHLIRIDLGGNIETELKIHAIRIEPDGIIRRQAEVQFSCDPICIADMDASIFSKWICEQPHRSIDVTSLSFSSRWKSLVEGSVSFDTSSILFSTLHRWFPTSSSSSIARAVESASLWISDV